MIKLARVSPMRVWHGPAYLAKGDLNRDGKSGLVIADERDDDILILFGK